jgi:hypothetical protein
MEPEGSLPCPQVPATRPSLEPDGSSLYHPILFTYLFIFGFVEVSKFNQLYRFDQPSLFRPSLIPTPNRSGANSIKFTDSFIQTYPSQINPIRITDHDTQTYSGLVQSSPHHNHATQHTRTLSRVNRIHITDLPLEPILLSAIQSSPKIPTLKILSHSNLI